MRIVFFVIFAYVSLNLVAGGEGEPTKQQLDQEEQDSILLFTEACEREILLHYLVDKNPKNVTTLYDDLRAQQRETQELHACYERVSAARESVIQTGN